MEITEGITFIVGMSLSAITAALVVKWINNKRDFSKKKAKGKC